MKKDDIERVLKSYAFLIPSIAIFTAVTVMYFHEFYNYDFGGSFFNIACYWSAYILISLFLQYVIFVNARKIIEKNK